MILVDTSVWVDHLRKSDSTLKLLLGQGDVLSHPLVIGELAVGHLHPREAILATLGRLPMVTTVSHDEALSFISHYKLYGLGIGYIDIHLLAATKIKPGTVLWTRDKRLVALAESLNLAFRS
jgi:predicted nucleic acid-binding protein